MSDVAFETNGLGVTPRHGRVVTGVDMTGHSHTVDPVIPLTAPTASGLRTKYDNRFDDYNYYSA